MLSPDDLKTVLASPSLRHAHGLELPQGSLNTLAINEPAFANFYSQWTSEGQPRYAAPTPTPTVAPAPVPAHVVVAEVAPVAPVSPVAPVAPVVPVAAPTPAMSPYGPPPTPQFPSPESSPQFSQFSRDPAAATATNFGYTNFMNSPNAVRPTGLNRPGTTQMLWGFGVAIVGVIVTVVSWTAAAPGGTFVVAWGAVLFGTIRGIIGAVRMSRG